MNLLFEVFLNSSDSIKLELIWKTMIGSLKWQFLLPILFLLCIMLDLLLPVTVNELLMTTTHCKQITLIFIYDVSEKGDVPMTDSLVSRKP